MRAVVLAMALWSVSAAGVAAERDAERRKMVDEINAMAATVARETGIERFSREVLAAMETVPRHEFVPGNEQAAAYRNRPLSVGHGQTISQPFIVAMMTELLRVKKSDRILEVAPALATRPRSCPRWHGRSIRLRSSRSWVRPPPPR